MTNEYDCHNPGHQFFFFEIFELINFQAQVTVGSAWINLLIFKTRSQFMTNFLQCMKLLFLYGEGGPELG